MSPLVLFFLVLFGTLIAGMPVFFCLLATALALMYNVTGDITPSLIVRSTLNGVNSFTLLAIPFFVLAGDLMGGGGISKRIVSFCNALVGHVKGGLGYVATLASMIFAGISGSALADTTAIGSILLPVMNEEGYDKDRSTALICASGTIGPIIPPSMPMVVFGVAANVSITSMFLGGVFPGIIIGIMLMIFWRAHVKANPARYEKATHERSSAKQVWESFKGAVWALLLLVILMGGILSGIFTATEAGVVGVVYALVVSLFIYRELSIKQLLPILVNSAKTTATILCICGSATCAGYFITTAQIPTLLVNFLMGITSNKWVLISIIQLLLLLIGCVMDLTPAILILAPLLTPIVTAYGFSPVYFGVIMVMNLCIGLLTPPVGSILYVGCGLSKISMARMSRALLPNYVAMIIALLITTYIPALATWLPSITIG